jgi:integrase
MTLEAAATVGEAAHLWLLRGRGQHGEWARSTRERYERIVRRHFEESPSPDLPPISTLGLSDLTVDRVAEWSAANERVLAPTSAVIALITLKAICRFAVRRGWMEKNPTLDLEPSEKPHWRPGRVGILEGAPLARVLDHAGNYRQLFELLAFTGLRIGEALGLTWADVDFERDVLRVHRQLSRYKVHADLKTQAGRREIVLAPAMVRLLRARWIASSYKGPDDFIFATSTGRCLDYRKVGEAFRTAVRRTGIREDGRLSLHSLRHGFASLLIAEGLDIVFVSRQLGHADASVTLSVYAHLFAREKHASLARSAIEACYALVTPPPDPNRLSLAG